MNQRHFAISFGPIGAKECCRCMLACTDVDSVGLPKYWLKDSSISVPDCSVWLSERPPSERIVTPSLETSTGRVTAGSRCGAVIAPPPPERWRVGGWRRLLGSVLAVVAPRWASSRVCLAVVTSSFALILNIWAATRKRRKKIRLVLQTSSVASHRCVIAVL